MSEGQAFLFSLALTFLGAALLYVAHRIGKRIPWLNQAKEERRSLLFGEQTVQKNAPAPSARPASNAQVQAASSASAALMQPASKQVQRSAVQATKEAVASLHAYAPWQVQDARITTIPFLLDAAGMQHAFNLHASQHYVVCGASRMGKGNLVQLVTLSALTLGPAAVECWFVDCKGGLDYSFATKLKHARLYADAPEADGTVLEGLQAVSEEMRARNEQMFNVARNIYEYKHKTGKQLPIIVVVVDEAAELIESKEATALLKSIARMGAASGIVLIVATQYPTVEALPSQIQANALNRVCFALESSKQTAVALALSDLNEATYDPAFIGERGVAVFKQSGNTWAIGRVPEVTDQQRERVIRNLVAHYPREVSNVSTGLSCLSEEKMLEKAGLNGLSDQTDQTDSFQTDRSDNETLYMRELAIEGLSRSEARERMATKGYSLDNNKWSELRAELGLTNSRMARTA